MKILLATMKPFNPVALKIVTDVAENAGRQMVFLEQYTDTSELVAAVSDVDALIVRSDKVTKEVLDSALKLRIVVRAGAGYDNIDLQSCTARNIVAMNTPGQNSNAVAELAFLMMLYQARLAFTGRSGSELRGKKIGFHAFGNVGKYMAEIANGFGMDTYAFDPFIEEKTIKGAGVKVCSNTRELYSKCQYVSLHMPVNSSTIKTIGYDILKLMPVNPILLNTARKELIDEDGLLRIFEERDDLKYLSDVAPDCKPVFEEKYQGRFFFTEKKMGAQTKEANINALVAAAHQIVDFFETGNEKFRVN